VKEEKFCRYHGQLVGPWKEMEPQAGKELREHVRTCSHCQEKLQQWEKIQTWLKEYGQVVPPAGLEGEIVARVVSQRETTRRFRPGLVVAAAAGVTCLLIFLWRFSLSRPTCLVKAPALPERPELARPVPKARLEKPLLKTPVRKEVKTLPAKEEPATVVQTESGENQVSSRGEKILPEEPARLTEAVSSAAREKIVRKEISFSAAADSDRLASRNAAGLSPPVKGEEKQPGPPPYLLIKEKAELEKIWAVQNQSQNLSLPVPAVDFTSQMVLAVASTSGGKQYRVVSVEEKDDTLLVNYDEAPVRQDKTGENLPPYQVSVVNQRSRIEFCRVGSQ